MRIKKDNLYLLLTSLILINIPSIGFDIHAHLLNNTSINHFFGRMLNFTFFDIIFPRYNLLPILTFSFSLGGLLPSSTFFIFSYYFLLKNFIKRIDRFGFLFKILLLTLFIYKLIGFGVTDISLLSTSIFLITPKSEKPNALKWLIFPGLIAWPGLFLSTIVLLTYLLFNIRRRKLCLRIFKVLIINLIISSLNLALTNYIFPIQDTKSYQKYFELFERIGSYEDILDFPKLSEISIFAAFLALLFISSKTPLIRIFINLSKFIKIKINNALLSLIIILGIGIYYLFPTIIDYRSAYIYPPILYKSGLATKYGRSIESDIYDNAFCSLYIPTLICRQKLKNYSEAYINRLDYVNNTLYEKNK